MSLKHVFFGKEKRENAKTIAAEEAITVSQMMAALSPEMQAQVKSGALELSGSVDGPDGVTPYRRNADGTISVYNSNGQHLITKEPTKDGGFGGALSNIAGAVGDFASSDAGKLALLAGAAYFGAPALTGSSSAAGGAMGGGTGLTLGAGGTSGLTLGAGGAGLTASGASLAPSLGGAIAAGGTLAGVSSAGGASSLNSIFGSGLGVKDLLPIGAQILGASMGSDAAKGAADTQAQSAREALDLQRSIYNDSVARSKPFYDTSVGANSKLSTLLGLASGEGEGSLLKRFSETDFEADPGYQFRKDEGMKAVDNSGAARGMSLSGGTLKALQKYGQGFASNEYNNAYTRFNNDQNSQFNKLSSTAGGGQVANNVNSLATNFGQNAGNLITDTGNAQAAGQVGSANSWSNGLQGVVNNYQQNQLMNLLTQREKNRSLA